MMLLLFHVDWAIIVAKVFVKLSYEIKIRFIYETKARAIEGLCCCPIV